MHQASNLFWGFSRRKARMVKAAGIYLWDDEGNRYLDGSSGPITCNIGHGNAVVLAAMQKQMQAATFGMRLHFETNPAETLATRLAHLAPDNLDQVTMLICWRKRFWKKDRKRYSPLLSNLLVEHQLARWFHPPDT